MRKESRFSLSLRAAHVCVNQGTTAELNLLDYSKQNNLSIILSTFEDTDAAVTAYQDSYCDAVTSDRSHLAAFLAGFPNPGDHLIMPYTISEEPLGPVVPQGLLIVEETK